MEKEFNRSTYVLLEDEKKGTVHVADDVNIKIVVRHVVTKSVIFVLDKPVFD